MPNRPKTALLFVTIAVCVALGAYWFSHFMDRGDFRRSLRRGALTAGTGLYVDDHVAECHATQASGFQKTGHAKTFRRAIEAEVSQALDGRTFADPERGYEYRYHFEKQVGLSVSIPQKFGEDRFPLTYALGSGHNAVTFLTLIPDRLGDTVGIEHRVSLYPGSQGWDLDLTPGQASTTPRQDVEQHGKVIQGDLLTQCIGCHTTSAEITRQEIVNLRPNVGCQNCHGPGREHVIAIEQGQSGNYTGFTKQSASAEIALCGRCHRLPNSDANVKLEPDNIHIVRFQSVGLLQSECFQRGGKSLKCSTCHDPHQPVSHDAMHYVGQCLSCHGKSETKHCPISPRTGCIPCHMPSIDIHRGIRFHDHWIRVRKEIEGRRDRDER